jgi:hypothetical protein
MEQPSTVGGRRTSGSPQARLVRAVPALHIEENTTMTETSPTRSGPVSSSSYASTGSNDVTGWAGWVVFAGIMLIMLGAFQVIEGLVALFDEGYYLVAPSGLVLSVDYNTWGWVHLIIGILAIATGAGLIAGKMVARVVGIVLAVFSAILNLAFIPAYPVWSTVVIAVDVIVIYAIVVHGRELKS